MADNLTWTHADHTITIGDDMLKLFVVNGLLVNGEFASYREAVTKIDEAAHKHELTSHKRISVAILTEKGERATITGIHASNGSILGLPKDNYKFGGHFYPDVAWIADTIKQMHNLMKQADDLRKQLMPFEIFTHEARGSRTVDHGAQIDNLVAMIERKRAAAEKAASRDESAKS